MSKLKLFLCWFFLQLMCVSVFALEWQESAKIEHVFVEAKTTGTFVVYDVKNNRLMGYNQQRAYTRFVPASTYKIPNSLIALSTGVISNIDEVLPYGGGTHDIKTWEHDMHLADAIKVSNVPIYKHLARQIGMERMQEYVQKFKYGNMELGDTTDATDTFWLEGPLKISAVEQTIFLAKLAQGILPVDVESQKLVRDITLLESGEGWELHGKTGWLSQGAEARLGLGWWVGWVEKDELVYAFALNLDGELSDANLEKRITLAKESLCILGLYPCQP